jgi:hypothetical protein
MCFSPNLPVRGARPAQNSTWSTWQKLGRLL